MNELIIVLSQADKAALGSVRCLPGLQAADDGEVIWLRGIPDSDKVDLRIRQLPGLHTYRLDQEEYLFPPGALTPIGKLKAFKWQPLLEFIKVELPVSAMPGKLNTKYIVRLVPSEKIATGDALLTDLQTWKNYAVNAPLVRLQALQFAVSDKERVLIMGSPLPPIPGREFAIRNNILLPCGYDFDPPVMAALIIARAGEWLLFDIDGQWQIIDSHYFVPATRSAVRLTKRRGYE